MDTDIKKLKKDFENAVHSYMIRFCDKHGCYYDPTFWVGNNIGGVVCVDDMFLDFEDIRYDIETEQPKRNIKDWYNYTSEQLKLQTYTDDIPQVNYKSWCMGLRPYNQEQLQKIKVKIIEIARLNNEIRRISDDAKRQN